MRGFPALPILLAVAVGQPVSSTLHAQAPTERQEALEHIQSFIARVCQRAVVSGSRTTVGGRAQIDADLKGLSRLLANVGGEVGANAERVSWDGVAQEQVVQAIESGNACGVQITELLVPLLLSEPVSPPDDPSPSAAPEAGATGETRYGARHVYGFLRWQNGLHPTAETCVASIVGAARSSMVSECARVPATLACSYEGRGDAPLYPICYWSMQSCRADYDTVTERLARSDAFSDIVRVGCEQTPRRAAVERYNAWTAPRTVGMFRVLRAPIYTTLWRGPPP